MDHGPLRVTLEGRVGRVLIDHPPTNLVDGPFVVGLGALLDTVASAGTTVVVFTSADPDFFLMHGDVEALSQTPLGDYVPATEPNRAAAIFQRLAEAPFVSIGLIDGAARGGGCEFLSALDLRYGTDRTLIGQPEAAMGILPGAGGTTRLPRIVGRSQALEIILTGRDLDAPSALAAGWLTAMCPRLDIERYVASIAQRIGALPPASVAAVKRVVDLALRDPAAALVAETDALGRLMASGAHHEPMRRYLAAGGQTRAGERGDTAALIEAMLS